MEQKRQQRKARVAQKRIYENIDTSYQGADPRAVQRVREVYPESMVAGSISSAKPVAFNTLNSVSGKIHEAANSILARNDRFGFVVLATTRVQISLTSIHLIFSFQSTNIPDTEDGLDSLIRHL